MEDNMKYIEKTREEYIKACLFKQIRHIVSQTFVPPAHLSVEDLKEILKKLENNHEYTEGVTLLIRST